MVSIKFTTLLLGLFTTCFIHVAALQLKHGNVHRDGLADAAADVASPEGVFNSVGERKILFGERKFLRDSKAAVDRSSYKINGDSKSSENTSSLKPSDGSISHLNVPVKSNVVGVSKSSSGSKNEPAGSQAKSIKAQNEDQVQKFHNAATQLVNFLNKDYGGMDRPHRKPPVHNGEPFH